MVHPNHWGCVAAHSVSYTTSAQFTFAPNSPAVAPALFPMLLALFFVFLAISLNTKIREGKKITFSSSEEVTARDVEKNPLFLHSE